MDWSTEQPINELPNGIKEIFRDEAKFLYHNLLTNQLKVILIPAPDPHFPSHKIRVAVSHNPEWYSELYRQYNYFRRDRSEKALKRISEFNDQPYLEKSIGAVLHIFYYDKIYRELIQDRLINGPSIENIVRKFFDLEPVDEKDIYAIRERYQY